MITPADIAKFDIARIKEEIKKLHKNIEKIERKRLQTRLAHASRQLKNTSELKSLRKEFARLQTLKTFLLQEALGKKDTEKETA
jgi:ribosomal protein L29